MSSLDDVKEFTYAPVRHQYSLGHITLFLAYVVSAGTSLRGASRAMALAMAVLSPP